MRKRLRELTRQDMATTMEKTEANGRKNGMRSQVRSFRRCNYAYSFIESLKAVGLPCDDEHDSESAECPEAQSEHRQISNPAR